MEQLLSNPLKLYNVIFAEDNFDKQNQKMDDIRHTSITFKGEAISLDQWIDLVTKYPSVALDVIRLADEDFVCGPTIASLKEMGCGSAIIKKVIEEPKLVGRLPGIWGALIQLDNTMESQLRIAFKASVSEAPANPKQESRGCVPMSVYLPDEEVLFPYIISSLFNNFYSSFSYGKPVDRVKRTVDAMTIILPDPSILKDYIPRIVSTEFRLALCWIKLWHPKIDCGWKVIADDLITIYRDGAPLWFLRSLTLSLIGRSSKTDESARRFLNKLLELGIADFALRLELQRVFATWRQTSVFPVQRSKHLSIWPAMF